MNNLEQKEAIEIEYWKNSKTENPNTDSLENIVNKLSEAKILFSKLEQAKDGHLA